MHLSSVAVATDDKPPRYLAQITTGSRNRREVMHEWEARSLREAGQEAEDWLNEMSARLGIGDDRLRLMPVMQERWDRLRGASNLPDLPVPTEKYLRALESVEDDTSAAEGELKRRHSPAPSKQAYPSSARVCRTVEAARAAGIVVAGIRVWRDGSIAVFDASSSLSAPALRQDE